MTSVKLQPTKEQVEVILGAIDHYNFDKIDAEMISGEGNFMYVAVTEDGVVRGAFFDVKGNLVGDWH